MSQRKKLLLDLDQTVLCSEPIDGDKGFPFTQERINKRWGKKAPYTEKNLKDKSLQFDFHDMDGYYIVFERPNLQEFLDFAFKNYDVSIWTAATKDYALFIIKHIILKNPNRQLEYIMFSHHCDISRDKFDDNSKDLRLIWDEFKLEGFNRKNTVIIDDLEEIYECQPKNAINIKAFEILEVGSENDDELKKIRNILEIQQN